jgi:CheY-like chemotaxis protein
VDAALPPVLVVDDNPINLKVAEGLLRKAGYAVLAVASGAEAVQAAGTTACLAVLMDCHMPGMDGFEATRLIRALPAPFGEVTVIALTASTSETDLEACRRSGMVEVLTKPASLADMERVLTPLRSGLIAKSTPLG